MMTELTQMAHAYRVRHHLGHESPMIYRVADWMIEAMLVEAAMDGRPATREEIDRFASAYLGTPVQIKMWGET